MPFKDDMDAADKRYWNDAREERMMDILEACVNKIDELESSLEDANKNIEGLMLQVLSDEKRFDKRIESLQKQINRDPEL